MAVNNVSGSAPRPQTTNANPQAPKPAQNARAGMEHVFANDAWFAADGDIPTRGDPVGGGGYGGGPEVNPRTGNAPGGRVVGRNGGSGDVIDEGGGGGFFRSFFSSGR